MCDPPTKKLKRVTIGEACRSAWAAGTVEKICAVADGLRLQHGFNYAQVHAVFCESIGKEIELAYFDEIMRLGDDGYTGPINQLRRGL